MPLTLLIPPVAYLSKMTSTLLRVMYRKIHSKTLTAHVNTGSIGKCSKKRTRCFLCMEMIPPDRSIKITQKHVKKFSVKSTR